MPTDQLPLTEYPQGGGLWSQREYVACVKKGWGFTCHRATDMTHWFHYRINEGGTSRCVSLLVCAGTVERRVEHAFTPTFDWIEQCRTAVTASERPHGTAARNARES